MAKKDESQSKVYRNGKLWTGPDRGWFILALAMVTLPEIPFLVAVCPYFEHWLSAGIYVISLYLCLSVVLFQLMAAFSDPGIVPRGPELDDVNPFSLESKVPLMKKTVISGVEVDTKWCDTCNLYRPPRSSHCSICNNCVEKFDHHCPWIGNCIGRRNYRFFLYFVFTASIEALYIIAVCVAHMVMNTRESMKPTRREQFQEALDKSAYFSIILPIYMICALAFVGGLAGFHATLISRGITTNESIKKSYRGHTNPHHRGVFPNFLHSLYGPWYPSAVTINYPDSPLHRSHSKGLAQRPSSSLSTHTSVATPTTPRAAGGGASDTIV